jgi:hypothetical protein
MFGNPVLGMYPGKIPADGHEELSRRFMLAMFIITRN